MKDSLFKTWKAHWIFVILIFIYICALSYKLVAFPKPFYDWDESIYVQVGKEMVIHGSPTPLWQGEAWLEKPPLAPLIYGLVIRYIPAAPEITTRLLSLYLAVFALCLIYLWVLKGTKNKAVALLSVVIVACDSVFLQRAQTVNTDVFLLIGWLGYLLTFPRFWISLAFLFFGVFSKSLLGFYPIGMIGIYELYRYIQNRQQVTELMRHLRIMLVQTAIMLVWFVIMTAAYGNHFIQVHFVDHMVRRVTSSIESHFGKRTYYIDLVYLQYGYYSLIALGSALTIIIMFWKKKIKEQTLLALLYLLPWFLFLNLTKTKISWYIYPAIPQVAILIAYPFSFLKQKLILWVSVLIVSIILINQTFNTQHFFTSFYSEYDETYRLSLFAKQYCSQLAILIDSDGRQTNEVLTSLHLTISTSTLYGNHPSIVYYSTIPVEYDYNITHFQQSLASYKPKTCIAVEQKDNDIKPGKELYEFMKRFGTWTIYRKIV